MKQAIRSVYKSPEGRKAIEAVYDSLLDRWPVPYEKKVLKTRAGYTFTLVCGEIGKPALVLLHGSSSNSAMWIGDVSEYAKHYRVYALDLPGEPGKSTDIRPDLTTTLCADWLYDVFNELGIDKATVVGISLGGWYALKFLTAYPDRADRLVLLCPAGIGPLKLSVILYTLPMKLLGKKGEVISIKKVMGIPELADETIEYSRLISKNYSPYMGAVPIFSDEELKRLKMPVLIVAGGRDVLIDSAKTMARIKNIIPHATAVLLPEAGHGLIDQKNRILNFLLA